MSCAAARRRSAPQRAASRRCTLHAGSAVQGCPKARRSARPPPRCRAPSPWPRAPVAARGAPPPGGHSPHRRTSLRCGARANAHARVKGTSRTKGASRAPRRTPRSPQRTRRRRPGYGPPPSPRPLRRGRCQHTGAPAKSQTRTHEQAQCKSSAARDASPLPPPLPASPRTPRGCRGRRARGTAPRKKGGARARGGSAGSCATYI